MARFFRSFAVLPEGPSSVTSTRARLLTPPGSPSSAPVPGCSLPYWSFTEKMPHSWISWKHFLNGGSFLPDDSSLHQVDTQSQPEHSHNIIFSKRFSPIVGCFNRQVYECIKQNKIKQKNLGQPRDSGLANKLNPENLPRMASSSLTIPHMSPQPINRPCLC